jgi:tetratricopeptide (TPR) repeat protein
LNNRPTKILIPLLGGLIGIFFVIQWFFQSHESKKKIAVAPIQATIPFVITTKKLANSPSLITTSWPSLGCEKKLKESLGYDKCNNECFSSRIVTKNKDLSDFIREGWDFSDNAFQAPKSKLGRLYRGLQAIGIHSNGITPRKDFPKAVQIFESLVKEDSENMMPYLFYAVALKRSGKIQEAQKVFIESIKKVKYESYIASYKLALMKAAGTDPLNAMKVMMISEHMPEFLIGDIVELEEISKMSYLIAMNVIAHKSINSQNRGQDLLWNRNDDMYSRLYIEAELPDVAQRWPHFENSESNFERVSFYPSNPDDKNCNIEDVKENLAVRLEWLKSL